MGENMLLAEMSLKLTIIYIYIIDIVLTVRLLFASVFAVSLSVVSLLFAVRCCACGDASVGF